MQDVRDKQKKRNTSPRMRSVAVKIVTAQLKAFLRMGGRGISSPTLWSNARACAMHSHPVAGRENFPRQNLIDAISEWVSREKKIERQ